MVILENPANQNSEVAANTKKAGTSIIVALKQCYRKGLFNNCVTLKLPFFDPPTIMLYYK